jgi:hypothetical protein
MIGRLFGARETIEVPCTVELENTAEFLQANVSLQGVVAEFGDRVLVHDAPTSVPFGAHEFFERRATLTRANAIDRLLAKASAYLELTELYEVGFDRESVRGNVRQSCDGLTTTTT